jgi:phosphohistidine phosphatase
MRLLTVIRHAKAEDASLHPEDIARPLTDKGMRDARASARILAGLQPPVDAWLTSPAVRARETTDALIAELGYTKTVGVQDDAYPGPADRWLPLIAATSPDAHHLAIVGHNPGLEELIAGLCAGGALHLNFRLPTAALAHIELEIARWDQIRWGCGQLRLLLPPKAIRK